MTSQHWDQGEVLNAIHEAIELAEQALPFFQTQPADGGVEAAAAKPQGGLIGDHLLGCLRGVRPPMPLTSPPAQKLDPAPVISTQRTAGSSATRAIVRRSAGEIVSPSALRTSGRFRVRVATPSSSSASRWSARVSRVCRVVGLVCRGLCARCRSPTRPLSDRPPATVCSQNPSKPESRRFRHSDRQRVGLRILDRAGSGTRWPRSRTT